MNSLPQAFVVVGAMILTALAIYMTPLKHINLVEPSIYDIDPTTFNDEFKKNPDNFIFIDVRSESAYTAAHAVGSKSMPLHTLYDMRHSLPKSGKKIILICSGGRASGVGYSYLEHFGFRNIARIDGGIENWVLQGLPVDGRNIPSIPN